MKKILNEDETTVDNAEQVNTPNEQGNSKAYDKLIKDAEENNDYKANKTLSELKKDFNAKSKPKDKAEIFIKILDELIQDKTNKVILNNLFRTYGEDYTAQLGTSLGTNEMYRGNQFIQFLNNNNFKDFFDKVRPKNNDFSKLYNLYANNDLLTDDYVNNKDALIYKKSLYDKSMSDITSIVELDKRLLKDDISPSTLRVKESLMCEDTAVRDALLLNSSGDVLDLPVIKNRISSNNLDIGVKADSKNKFKNNLKKALDNASDDEVDDMAKEIYSNPRLSKAIDSIINNANNNN